MTDAQHLKVTGSLPSDPTTTPSSRGHRHKRSFAISGDFDFLKQPVSLPPLPCNTPEADTSEIDNPDKLSEQWNRRTDEDFIFKETPKLQTADRNTALSPRFFISEEPKFSSPFHGVPDAIINLDDALKTKPKSFKSHRRSESAPAELAVLLNAKSIAEGAQMIEEENDDDVSSESVHEAPFVTNEGIKGSLLSPLRPSSPSKVNYAQSPAYNASPARSPTRSPINYKHDNLNTLKINRQKQRYCHYTKKLPITSASSIQSQSLSEKVSSSSLSSACAKTPLSLNHTPSKQVYTPSTPITPSCSNNNWEDYTLENNGRLTSPFRSQQIGPYVPTSTSNTPRTIFRYEPKVYDMPHGTTKQESMSSRDDKTLYKREMSFCEDHDITDEDGTVSDNEALPISRELLFGQPGDSVDLSSLSSPSKELPESYRSSSRENSINTAPRINVDFESPTSASEVAEPRSVSDSAFIVQTSRKNRRGMRTRLNIFLMNIFKTNNQDGPTRRKS